jgi:hypothetical protein
LGLLRTWLDVLFISVRISIQNDHHHICRVLVACIGQFWPGELKNSPYVLGPCVATYFFLTALIWILQTYVQKDAIAYTKHHPGNPGIVLRSKMKRFDDQYTLKACMKGESVVRESSATQYVGNFFNENAELQVDNVSTFVNDVLHQLDAPSESSNGTKKDS